MILQTPPEVADGGYWYVVPVVIDPEGGQSPGDLPGIGWCAWYGTGGEVVIRFPRPVAGLNYVSAATAGDILGQAGYSGRPYGRIGGS